MKRFIKKSIIAVLISAVYFPAAFYIDIFHQELFETAALFANENLV